MNYRALLESDITAENENEIKATLLTTLNYYSIESTFNLATFATLFSERVFVAFIVDGEGYGFGQTAITIDPDVDLADQLDSILEQYFAG